jgi:hypothetical protein
MERPNWMIVFRTDKSKWGIGRRPLSSLDAAVIAKKIDLIDVEAAIKEAG